MFAGTKKMLASPVPYSVGLMLVYLTLGPSGTVSSHQTLDQNQLRNGIATCSAGGDDELEPVDGGSCKPKPGWVCSTDRADYLDMCWNQDCA
jgi:hypothetical protein